MDAAERQRRLSHYHAPFHNALEELLERRKQAGKETLLVTVHSFTPVYKDVQRPWPIGLGAITPRAAEGTNLLATFALSATHVAFSSARMEPVFMMTSHSAATAAALALRQSLPVQEISYPELSALLLSDGQILGMNWYVKGIDDKLPQ